MAHGHLRRLERGEDAAVAQQPEAGTRLEVIVRFLFRLAGKRPHAERRVRGGMLRARLVERAVEVERLQAGVAVGEEPREGVGQAEVGSHLRAVVRTAEHPDLRRGIACGERLQWPEAMPLGQRLAPHPGHEVPHVVGEHGGPLVGEGIEREGRAPIRARRAPEPEVDPAGRDGLQHAELLGDLERRVVRQHHACAADADAVRDAGDGCDQHFRRCLLYTSRCV